LRVEVRIFISNGITAVSRHLLDTWRGGLLQTEEVRPQNINGEVMQKRRQPVLSLNSTTTVYTNNLEATPRSEETTGYQDQPIPATTPPYAQIAHVQSRLAQLGYLVGRPDGVWGRRSRDALRAFKAANGLVVDNFWDDATRATLFSASAAYAPAPMTSSAKK
jgi:hypothetical protein